MSRFLRTRWAALLTFAVSSLIAAGLITAAQGLAFSAQARAESPSPPAAAAPANAAQAKAADHTMTPDAARDMMSRLSDQEVRALLLKMLEETAAADAPPPPPADMLFTMQSGAYVLKNRLRTAFAAIPELPSIGPFIIKRITKNYGTGHAWTIALNLVFIFAGALIGEALSRRLFRPVLIRLPMLDAGSDFGKLGILLIKSFVRLFDIAVFAVVAVVLFLILYQGHEAARLLFWSLFAFIVLMRAAAVALSLILSPRDGSLRLPQLDDAAARRLNTVFLSLIALMTASVLFGTLLSQIGVDPALRLAAGELIILINVMALVVVIWTQRQPLARLLGIPPAADGAENPGFGGLFAAHWHIFAVSYVLAMGVTAVVHRLVTLESQAGRMLPTLVLLIAFPMLDGLLRMTVRHAFGRASRAPEPGAAADQSTENRDLGRVILHNARILLIVVGVIALSHIWDIRLDQMAAQGLGARIAQSLFDIVLTLVLASAAWGIIKTTINRQLPHEERDALDLLGDEGGKGLSRLETLLPLLRNFLFVTLTVIVALIILASLGVQIGPLLAGAGVVGIAIGFGAQTLVRDIISGIFFLIDDAFRVGEYIDVGEGKGTVERMSIRSLMLRHHLGQVNTIPYGVIRRITNYSRDWVIMKLEMRVPFETDLEKLRKIVKKVGEELMQDPEHGPHFIQPLKSQGVHRMDDSSLVVRVKFMARPGEQFVLRREVFRRVQEAFQKNGIQFAPRRVIVDASAAPGMTAAAAAAAVLADDEAGGGEKLKTT